MKLLQTLLFTVTLSSFIACQSNKKNKEIDDLTIKESNKQTSQNTISQSDEKIYFIQPLSDTLYTGTVEEKYPNGIVKYKGFYRFGKKHGEWIYFYDNGNLWSEAEFNRDKMQGKSKVYYPNGQLHYSGFYKNDLRDSIWCYYDTTGKELYIEWYKNSRLIKRNSIQK